MKKVILTIAAAICCLLMALPAMAAEAGLKAELQAVWAKYNSCYKTGDIQCFMSTLAADPVSIGTGPSEFWIGSQANEQALQQAVGDIKGLKYTYTKVQAGSKGDVAWMAAEVFAQVEMKDKIIRSPARLTTVFVRQDGQWKIQQCHMSIPSADMPYYPAR